MIIQGTHRAYMGADSPQVAWIRDAAGPVDLSGELISVEVRQDGKARMATVAAGDDKGRNAQIQSDYERRLAGADAERDRLQEHWRACATDRLSAGAAAAGEIAAADRLRRDSAARIVRSAELAQSERDEVIDMYQAVHEASQGLEK